MNTLLWGTKIPESCQTLIRKKIVTNKVKTTRRFYNIKSRNKAQIKKCCQNIFFPYESTAM